MYMQSLPAFLLRCGSAIQRLATQPLRATQWLENENTEEIRCSGETSGIFWAANPPNCI